MERSYFFSFLNICLCPGMLKTFRVHFMDTEFREIKFPQRLARMNLLSVIGKGKESKEQL